jgi:hypothetical protein
MAAKTRATSRAVWPTGAFSLADFGSGQVFLANEFAKTNNLTDVRNDERKKATLPTVSV